MASSLDLGRLFKWTAHCSAALEMLARRDRSMAICDLRPMRVGSIVSHGSSCAYALRGLRWPGRDVVPREILGPAGCGGCVCAAAVRRMNQSDVILPTAPLLA